MGTPDIFLEHKKGEKVRKMLRVEANREIFVIGTSKEADLRLQGEGITGCHAVLRYRAPHWYVCDVSGTESLMVNDVLSNEVKVENGAHIDIGMHRIQLFTRERNGDIFADTKETTAKGELKLHQVVVRVRGKVVETHALKATESFTWFDGETDRILPAPRSGQWVKTEFGVRMVQQRLVTEQELAIGEKFEFDRDMRKPIAMALALLLAFLGVVGLLSMGETKKPELAIDQKSMEMIYNAKVIKKKRLESQKEVKVAKAKAGGTSEDAPTTPQTSKATLPEESTAPKLTSKTTAALTSLRQSGLGNLIGKIAKRANSQNVMVAAVGVAPDIQGAGRAIFSTGTTTNGGGGSASKEGPTYRLGGIATKGKAGGVGNFKDGTALAGGAVGSGNVMALSDDEETMIDGGLDKDAIAEVIKRNIGQIRYCYERQLSSNPDLYGKVLVKFTIGAEGDVSAQRVDGSTLKSAMVEGCILRRMAGWKFPLPRGGTQVRVSYPFLFKALE